MRFKAKIPYVHAVKMNGEMWAVELPDGDQLLMWEDELFKNWEPEEEETDGEKR